MLWVVLGVAVVGGFAALVIGSRISFGRTARGMAVFGKAAALEALLAKEPRRATEADEQGEQPMHAAAANGHVAVIDVLLKHGASPNARCTGGGTPLTMAVFYGSVPAVQRLIAAGADVDECDDLGMTALHASIARGNVDVARALLEAGAQLDLKDAAGRSALDVAEQFNQPELVKLLQARGARHGREVRMKDLKAPKSAGGKHRVPEVLGMPTDYAPLLQAVAEAQRTLPEAQRLFAEQAQVAVKGALDPRQPQEKMWLAVTELDDAMARGALISNPLQSDRSHGSGAQLALPQIEDWLAELPDGSLRGGFGLRVMMQHARDEYGELPASFVELARRLPR